MVAEAAIRKMLQVPPQAPHAPRHPRVLVNLVADPSAPAAIEQPYETVGIGITVTEEPAEVIRDPGHRPTRALGESSGAQRLNFST